MIIFSWNIFKSSASWWWDDGLDEKCSRTLVIEALGVESKHVSGD